MVTNISTETEGSTRANIELDVHEIYKDLVERSAESLENAPFFQQKDVFMWAVAVGYKNGKKQPLATGRTQPFRWEQLSQDQDVPALQAIAIADTGDVEILLHKDKILRIAEEYANAGIRIIKQDLVDQPGRLLWNLTDLVRRVQEMQ